MFSDEKVEKYGHKTAAGARQISQKLGN